MNNQTPPCWDLSNVYPALDSAEFSADFEKLKAQLDSLGRLIAENIPQAKDASDSAQSAALIQEALERVNAIYLLAGTLNAYIHSFITTDSFNTQARRLNSEFELAMVAMEVHEVALKKWLGSLEAVLPDIIAQNPVYKAHAFFLLEAAEQSKYLMSDAEEE